MEEPKARSDARRGRRGGVKHRGERVCRGWCTIPSVGRFEGYVPGFSFKFLHTYLYLLLFLALFVYFWVCVGEKILQIRSSIFYGGGGDRPLPLPNQHLCAVVYDSQS